MRIRAKLEKTFVAVLWLGLEQNKRKIPFVAGLWLKYRTKIDKNDLFGRVFDRIRQTLRTNTFW